MVPLVRQCGGVLFLVSQVKLVLLCLTHALYHWFQTVFKLLLLDVVSNVKEQRYCILMINA